MKRVQERERKKMDKFEIVKLLKQFKIYNPLRRCFAAFAQIDRARFSKLPSPPVITSDSLKAIEEEIELLVGRDYVIRYKILRNEFEQFKKKFDFSSQYNPKWSRYERKIAESFLAYTFLGLEQAGKDYKYIDCASAGSTWASMLRKEHGIDAWSLDLTGSSNAKEHFIQADATNTPLDDNSADGLSIQSALELFSGDTDIRFIKECARILRGGGGRIFVSPLYLNTAYCNVFGKSYFKNGEKEADSKKYVRLDYNIPFTRIYDAKHLDQRILSAARECGLKYKIVIVDGEDLRLIDRMDSFIYLHFCIFFYK